MLNLIKQTIKFTHVFLLGLILFNMLIIYLSDKNTLGIITSAISLIVFLSIFTKFGLNLVTLKLTSIFFEKKDKDHFFFFLH